MGTRSSGSSTPRRSKPTERCSRGRIQLDPFAAWVVRCDRIDFPPGGIAYTHTHPGPGIRYLLHGRLDIHTDGAVGLVRPGRRLVRVGPGSRARDRIAASADGLRPRAAPARPSGPGKRTIRYVDPADEETPEAPEAHRVPRAPAAALREDRAGSSSSTSSSSTASSWRSACPARATWPCSTRSTTRRSDSSPAATRSAPPTWPTRTASSRAGRGSAWSREGPGRRTPRGGVHTAFQDSTPLILLIGQVGREMMEREAFQEIDYRQMFGPMAKWVGADRRRRPDPRARLARVPRRHGGPSGPGRARAARGHARRRGRASRMRCPYDVTRAASRRPPTWNGYAGCSPAPRGRSSIVGGAPWSAAAHDALTAWCAASCAARRLGLALSGLRRQQRPRSTSGISASAPTLASRSGCATRTSCS